MTTDARHTVHGACPLDCPDTCSWQVTVENGQAVALHGTRDHPFTRGNLCVKLNRYLEHTRAPDRLLYPLRRVGKKGAGAFQRIGWDEALGEIASRFKDVAATHGGEAIWPFFGTGHMGHLQGMLGSGFRLWNALGASQHRMTICGIAGIAGANLTLGQTTGMDPEDLRFAKLIILWGFNPLTSSNHVWRFISEARKGGARLVVIDPIRTRSAAQADEHIAILPGTDAALALGLLNVVVGMGAEDADFLARHTSGWDEYRRRILDYPPERVAAITRVPVATIVALGRRLATTRPTAIRASQGMQRHAGGGMALRTISTIPAVTGDTRHLGGGVIYTTGQLFTGSVAGLHQGDLPPPTTRILTMTRLGENLLALDDPPVKALLIYGANPAASSPQQETVRRGLAREDLFTVVIENFPTDTVDYADIVLPSTMQTEHADLHNAYGHLYLLWNQPAVAPPGECLPHTEIFRRLARALGLNEPCLYDSDDDLARSFLASPHPALAGITLEALKERGWMRLNLPTPYVPFADGFPTPSGKLEFHSEKAAALGLDPVPGYTPPAEVTDAGLALRYPLALVAPASHYFLNTIFANMPEMQSRAGPPRITLNPEDARARGITQGDVIRIFNDRGAFEATAEIGDIVQPGVVAGTKGYWPKLVGERSNLNATVAERDSDMGGGAVFHDNRVEVERLRRAAVT
ncbi:MAG: molybdopterin oxidoreductase family protein [Alphaproteobacteria bacterium]|nr:molybdopterin oxidoreductase family protein [Alphaproteobacteria bacterium]